ncbi:transmembrane protein 116 [Spea bombifrons]|uniref:transmembrane protein 116 n=1 Tax=Spea bombifrons TaxID=233779 RepID=UPI00234BCF5E|nr:transmembrane protein 116 [Spea bombifrons]
MDGFHSIGSKLDSIGVADVVWINDSLSDEWRGVYSEIKWIQVVTAILSVLGSGSIIGYAVFHSAVRSPEVRPLFYLSLSDLLLALCWLLGTVLYRRSVCSKNVACYNLQSVGQMFYLSTFFYTLNYMWQLCSSLKRKLENDLHKISDLERCIGRIALILSSVVPAFLIIPVLYFGNSEQCYGNATHPHSCLVVNVGSSVTSDVHAYTNNTCKAIHFYITAVFLSTFFLTVISILVLLGFVVSLLRKCKIADEHRTVITVTKRAFLLYSAIFLFCSLPGVALTLCKLVDQDGKSEDYRVLYFFQAFTSISQGFLNCLAYGWTHQMLRCLKQNSFHDVETQTPLLRSQKRHYASTQTSTFCTQPQNITVL